jgi:L-threonylcarbamoyladenylate synthase
VFENSWFFSARVKFVIHLGSRLIRGDFDTVAVRLTDNALISALCTKLGSALLSSSANITGKPIATSMLELNVSFKQIKALSVKRTATVSKSPLINLEVFLLAFNK